MGYKLKVFIFAILPVVLVLGIIPAIMLRPEVAEARSIATVNTFEVSPSVFEYKVSGTKRFDITLTNLSTQSAQFNMGDRQVITVAGHENIKHSYWVNLDGSTTRIYIKRLNPLGSTADMQFCEGVVVRIEPKGE